MSGSNLQALSILAGTFSAGKSRLEDTNIRKPNYKSNQHFFQTTGAAYGLSFYAIPAVIRTSSQANKAAQLAVLWHFGHKSLPLTYVGTGLIHLWLSWSIKSNNAQLEALAGGLTLAIVPFSIIVIGGTDDQILKIKGKDDESVVKELGGNHVLDGIAWRWAVLNAVRASMALLGAIISFYGLLSNM